MQNFKCKSAFLLRGTALLHFIFKILHFAVLIFNT